MLVHEWTVDDAVASNLLGNSTALVALFATDVFSFATLFLYIRRAFCIPFRSDCLLTWFNVFLPFLPNRCVLFVGYRTLDLFFSYQSPISKECWHAHKRVAINLPLWKMVSLLIIKIGDFISFYSCFWFKRLFWNKKHNLGCIKFWSLLGPQKCNILDITTLYIWKKKTSYSVSSLHFLRIGWHLVLFNLVLFIQHAYPGRFQWPFTCLWTDYEQHCSIKIKYSLYKVT